jgi:hypothetical protein
VTDLLAPLYWWGWGWSADPVPLPPAVDISWANIPQAMADAAQILGFTAGGPQEVALEPFAEAALSSIGLYLDRTEPINGSVPGVPPPPLRTAHATVTVNLWRAKDAPHGVRNAWSDDQVAETIPGDPLVGVYASINPYKGRWGLA